MINTDAPPYQHLVPDLILNACESLGLLCDGCLLALNSYENRVYRVGIEDGPAVVAKFYRPGRWDDPTIQEEHAFTQALFESDLPAVPPLGFPVAGPELIPGSDPELNIGPTLHHFEGFRFAIYPLQAGRWRELDDPEDLRCLGRLIARIHVCGETSDFVHRPRLTVARLGHEAYAQLCTMDLLPADLKPAYTAIVEQCLERVTTAFAEATAVRQLRLHGDCHLGNVLWREDTPFFVDFDDCMMGPAVQDLWMLLSGDLDRQARQMNDILDGYEVFRIFDYRELALIEPLRTLRMLYYSVWLARRWHDPAFPQNFPWFNTQKYWEEQILAFKEQLSMMDEPVLQRRLP